MELGISIPTPDNEADWDYVKQFVTSIISQLDIGRQNNQIQVGVATYRGILSSLSLSLSLSVTITCSAKTFAKSLSEKPS